jgi:transcriptional regulator GlxA family with amidase domain
LEIGIVVFDQCTDVDVFLLWDLLNRVRVPDWRVRLLGEQLQHVSQTGLTIPMHGLLEEANTADAVLFVSGPGTRAKLKDAAWLQRFKLDPERQLIGSICSGALLLAALGLLQGKEATTYPTAKGLLESYGVRVVERPFVAQGNVATAGGCLAAQYLAGWVIEHKAGQAWRNLVLKSIQPVGEGLHFSDVDSLAPLYAQASSATYSN